LPKVEQLGQHFQRCEQLNIAASVVGTPCITILLILTNEYVENAELRADVGAVSGTCCFSRSCRTVISPNLNGSDGLELHY